MLQELLTKLESIQAEALDALGAAEDEARVRELEVRYLGKKGALTAAMKVMGKLSRDERPQAGQRANAARAAVQEAIAARREALEAARIARLCADPRFDATLPPKRRPVGAIHPVTQISYHVEDVFRAMGFAVLDYPEAETEFYNFDALNIPATHPARDTQDTFWLADGNLMRTHTSPGQVRAMQEFGAPFRAIFPGRCYRYEAVDASHEHTFHQVEGLMIERELSVANLIDSMKILVTEILEREVTIRLRPGHFPFVEPGFELDIQCQVCGGAGCSVCKQSGWLELLPCGLVHPNVLRAGGLDPDEWSGWAFGLGLSRLVMMGYQIEDIRHLMGNDVRFLSQFRAG